MRTWNLVAAGAAVALLTSGCSLPFTGGDDGAAGDDVDLSFSYEGKADAGLIDQTVTITNAGSAAAAPTLTYVPLDADGEELAGLSVVTAYGSDEGGEVVPALTEVVEVLRFKGAGAADVADVRVDVVDEGMLDDDWPPANDLQVVRFDISGAKRQDAATLGAVALRNTYDEAITVRVVGLQFDQPRKGRPQHFTRVDELAGPLRVEPGARVKVDVPERFQARFYGSVKAYLAAG